MWGRFRLSYADPVTPRPSWSLTWPWLSPSSSPEWLPAVLCSGTQRLILEMQNSNVCTQLMSLPQKLKVKPCNMLPHPAAHAAPAAAAATTDSTDIDSLCWTSPQVKGQFQDLVYNHVVSALFLDHEIKTKVMIRREQTSRDQNNQTERNHPQEKRFDIPGVCSVCINRSDFLKQTLVHTARSAGCARLTDFRAALINGTKTAGQHEAPDRGKLLLYCCLCVLSCYPSLTETISPTMTTTQKTSSQ